MRFGPAFSIPAFSVSPGTGFLPLSTTLNCVSSDRPSFAAANHVVTLTRVTNERVVMVVQFSSVHFVSFEKSDVRALLQPKTATMR